MSAKPKRRAPLMVRTGCWWLTLTIDILLVLSAFLPWYWIYTTI